jgi:hypothetical protein
MRAVSRSCQRAWRSSAQRLSTTTGMLRSTTQTMSEWRPPSAGIVEIQALPHVISAIHAAHSPRLVPDRTDERHAPRWSCTRSRASSSRIPNRDGAHPHVLPERRNHVAGCGGGAEHRQDLGDKELVMVLGVTGAAIGDDDDPIARIGTGAGRGFHDVVRPHAH